MTGDDGITKQSNPFLEGPCNYTEWLARERDTALIELAYSRAALKLEISDNQKERDAVRAEIARLRLQLAECREACMGFAVQRDEAMAEVVRLEKALEAERASHGTG